MRSNPCLQCQLKNQDKNNQICLHCAKRLEYVSYIERELSFAMTNTETKPLSLRLPTLLKGAHLFGVISERF